MAFVELRKKGKLARYTVHVVYRINPKLGKGVFRFTKKGANFLHANFPQLDFNKAFRVFLDRDNGNLAFLSDEKGEFNITESKRNQYTIFNTDITSEIEKDSYYFIQPSKEYNFILVSVEHGRTSELPISKDETTQPETTQPTLTQPEAKDEALPKTRSKIVRTPKVTKANKEPIETKPEAITETKPETSIESKVEPSEPEVVKQESTKDNTEVVEATAKDNAKVTKVARTPKAAKAVKSIEVVETAKPIKVVEVTKPAEVAEVAEAIEPVKLTEPAKPTKVPKTYKVKAKAQPEIPSAKDKKGKKKKN